MKKIIIGIWVITIGLIVNGVVNQSTYAQQSATNDIQQTVFLDEEKSVSTGRVQGDVICFNSKKCIIEGVVEGDVLAASGEVEIKAEVSGSVRAVAVKKVTFMNDAIIKGNVSIASQDIVVNEKSQLMSDAMLFAGMKIELNGQIGRDMLAHAENITISGVVGRHVKVTAKQLQISQSAKIGADLNHTTHHSQIADRTVTGNIYHEQLNEEVKGVNNVYGKIFVWTLTIGLLMLLIVAFHPNRLKDFARKDFELKNVFLIAIGYAVVIIVPILASVLMLTLVAIPVSIVMFASWVILLIMSLPVGLYYVIVNSCSIIGKKSKMWHVAGLIIYGLLTPIAVIGWVMNVVLFGLGAGIIVKMITSSFKNREKK